MLFLFFRSFLSGLFPGARCVGAIKPGRLIGCLDIY